MKVDVKKVDATKRELTFEVSKERVTKKREEVFQELSKVAKIKGFRQGKVPRQVLESQYGAVAQEETVKKIIPEVYEEAIMKEKLSPIDLPEIVDVKFKDGGISFKAKFDIRPEANVKNYKGIKIKKKSSQVTDEELNKTLEIFQKGQGKDKEVKIDDDFAKQMGFPGLEEFKNSLRRQMEFDKERHNRFAVEQDIVDAVLKNAQLAIPPSTVTKQLDYRIHELRHSLEKQGLKKEDIDKRIEEVRKDLKTTSERDLKIFFIFEKIAELENIVIDKNENMINKVMGFLLKEAQWEEER